MGPDSRWRHVRGWRRRPTGRIGLRRVALIGLWLSLYTYYPLGLAEATVIPMFVGGLFAVPLMYLNRRNARLREVGILYAVLLVAFATTLVANGMSITPSESKALVLLGYSLFIAYALYMELRTWSARALLRLFTASVILVVVGSAFEVFAGFQGVSDAVRESVFGYSARYDRLRDITLAGRPRPSFFTAEPSDVAKFTALAGSCALGLAWHLGYRWLFVGLVALAGAGMWIIRSPITAIPAGVVILVAIDSVLSLTRRIKPRPLHIVLLVCAASVGTGVIYGTLKERLTSVTRGEDMSYTVRIGLPAAVGLSVMQREPVFGLGLGSRRLASEFGLGATGRGNEYLVNALVGFPIYLGLVGSLALLFLVVMAVRLMGGRRYVWALGMAGAMSLTIGSAYSPRLWCFYMVILAVGVHMTAVSSGRRLISS